MNDEPMTPEEIERERKYRITERLGVLCGIEDPTPEQIAMATAEADEWAAQHGHKA
jgi:hypothetical protein